MNIFALSSDPVSAAIHQCDKHVIKMPTESFQMMASAMIRHDVPSTYLPLTKRGTVAKGGYPNHPSTKWAGNTRDNFRWLGHHGIALCKEYTERYGRRHFCQNGIAHMLSLSYYIPDGLLEDFSVAIPEDSGCLKIKGFGALDVITKYKLYYAIDKKRIATWKQNQPDWFVNIAKDYA